MSDDVEFASTLATRIIELDGEDHYDLHMSYADYLTDEARLARHGHGV